MTSRSALSENSRIDPILHTLADTALLAQALRDERKNLMVFGDPSNALTEIGPSLQQHLASGMPSAHLAHFSGQHPAAMLGKINEGLAQQSLRQSAQIEANPSPDEFWFVHDAQSLQSDELQLLLQLNDHFPNWRVRWVLLFDATPALTTEQRLWIDQASGTWLKWPSKASAPWPSAPRSEGTEAEPAENQPELSHGDLDSVTPGVKAWLLGATGLATVLLVGAWLYGRAPSMEAATQPVPAAGLKPMPEGAASVTASTQNASPVSPEPPPKSALPRPMPESAAQGYRWLRSLPRESFVLQQGPFDTAAEAQRSIRQNAQLRGARVLMLKPTSLSNGQFVLVSGPFRSQERALNFKKKNKLEASTSIEPTEDLLQKSLPPQSRQGQSQGKS